MQEALYEVCLDKPEAYVSFLGPIGLTDDQILDMAIVELTYKSYISSVKIIPQ